MRKITALLGCSLFVLQQTYAQIDAGLFRYPDVSQTQIVFTYANDIWIIPKEGGTAEKLSSPPGVESFPKFSPDGKSIAFTGNYDGNEDVYVIPSTGGVPLRITEHGYPDRVVDWTPDGKRVLFASLRESGRNRFNQFYTVAAAGGADEKLPFPYAEFGSYSPDGKEMALVFESQAARNWKRYRGGWKADIHIFNFQTQTDQNITAPNDPGEEFPMWNGDYIYFLSDRGPEVKMNLWRYNTKTKALEQLTTFKEYDIHYPSMGPGDIVFENGGKLYLYQLGNGQVKEVTVNVVTDKSTLKPRRVSATEYIQHVAISPDGNRVLMEARGDIFSLPAEKGFVEDLTRTSGAAERYPAWSPDGKSIAYWSDQSGEYELYIEEPGSTSPPKKITSYGAGFRYNLFWSPDGKKLAFIDKAMRIKIVDAATGETTDVDRALRWSHGNLEGFSCSWSPDSRWLTYSRDLNNYHNAIFIFDTKNKKTQQVTNGFYDCINPVFDPGGKYLYLITTQAFQPYYSDIDNSFIYANSKQLAVVSLTSDTPSPLNPKNDTVAVKEDDAAKAGDKSKAKKDSAASAKKGNDTDVNIDFDGFESRLVLLPLKPGNYSTLSAVKGKLIYQKYDNTGAAQSGSSDLKYYDMDKLEDKTIMEDVDGYILSADGKKMVVQKGPVYAVISPQEGQKITKPLRINEMQMMVDPVQEWRQIYLDAWRIERDYFYDANMHGVDWVKIKNRYLKMLEGAMTRDEVNFVLGEMLGELNSSHTYKGGGDEENGKSSDRVGYLGIDWQADGDYYKIKKIVRGATWDAEVRSPLDMPGVDIKEGDYILAVNGTPITTTEEPFAAFEGLANKTVELTYNSTPSFTGAKKVVVQTMSDESRLRYLAWVEGNRKRVADETNNQVGYIYVPSTGIDGQDELMRQFNAQWDKKALVIDERFNSGGQIPDRFIEMLNRTPLAFWAIRDGSPWPWPPYAHFGPKVMLINGWSGSGGDAFPDFFRKKGLGPLIGKRTWGGLIGISGVPSFIDNGTITAPSFRMYNPDGTWFKEGHGVDPDIVVDEDLGAMAKGIDPQLERAITEIKELMKKGFTAPATPKAENRD
ncbi:MAG TPA: PDZ domain-containing protein [Chitinophagaceae bacterium]|nr:PDZ domain-containing protein [Chitinophagaceae bacterium]